jgi:lysophospholipid acyltransferase (LPLAT)-like uncharacterized protein
MADAPPPISKPRSSAIVVPNQARWHQRLVAALAFVATQLLTMTWRVRWKDEAGLKAGKLKAPVIFCLWHNRLAMAPLVYRAYVRRHHPGKGVAALISASKDGALLAAVFEKFGFTAVRGSSSRRGAQALVELASSLEEGYHAAITPDGPRGPGYQVKPGVVGLAQLTNAAILPASFHAHWKFAFKSWDKFQLPLPFTVLEITLGEPIVVPPEANEEQREVLRRQLQDTLLAISRD